MKKLILLAILLGLTAGTIYAETDTSPVVDVLVIDNYSINPVIANFITDEIDKTNEENPSCLIIQLDTPGGLLESTRQIVKSILNSKVPIVVYIAPSGSRAGSAGVFITYASHIAAMAPSTNIGAAHPVGIGITPPSQKKVPDNMQDKTIPQEPKDIMEEKIMNDVIAWITAIAEYRDRNVKWAKKAVEESKSLTQKEALKLKVVELLADNLDELMEKLDGQVVESMGEKITLETKDAQLNLVSPSLQEIILNYIAHPSIVSILMLLGTLGLIFEFTHPGIGFPGIAGFICLLLAFFSLQLFPVSYLGVALIMLAVVLFIAEAFTPTFGLLTLGGIVSLIFGAMMLSKYEHPFFFTPSLALIIPSAIAMAGITVFLTSSAVKTHRKKVITGTKGMLGKTAITITALKPLGKVSVHGEIWNAESINKKLIAKKQEVKIMEIKGLKLIVEKLKQGGDK